MFYVTASRNKSVRRLLLAVGVSLISAGLLTGCKSSPAPAPAANAAPAPAPTAVYPARPTAAPAALKVFHYYNNSFTLTTSDKATDDEISALVWELRDAARTHTFDKLKISQKDADSGSTTWFHIYRGTKCASEKYGKGKLPCGGSYHASGDYTISKVNGKTWDKGVLLHDEHETLLWNSEAPYTPSAN